MASSAQSSHPQELETLQSELQTCYMRIQNLEHEKQDYQDHLDDLIAAVAQRAQHIRDIERDLQRIQAMQSFSPEDGNNTSFQSELESILSVDAPPPLIYQTTPQNYVYPVQRLTDQASKHFAKRTASLKNFSPSRVQEASPGDMHRYYPTQSDIRAATTASLYNEGSIEMPIDSAFSPLRRGVLSHDGTKTAVLSPGQLQQVKSTESLQLKKTLDQFKKIMGDSPKEELKAELEKCKEKLKSKSEKLKGVNKAMDLKTQELNCLRFEISQLKLSLKLFKNSFFPRLKADLESIKRDLATHLVLLQKETVNIINSLTQRCISAQSSDRSRPDLQSVDLDRAKRIARLELEMRYKQLLEEKGSASESIELKMQVLKLEREKDELMTKVQRVLDAGVDKDSAVASVETLRRRQVEKSYSELALDAQDRLKKFQMQNKLLALALSKMKRGISELVQGLVAQENKGKISKRVLQQNKQILVGLMEGRQPGAKRLQFGIVKNISSPLKQEIKQGGGAMTPNTSTNSMSATPKESRGGGGGKALNPIFMMDL